MADLTLAERLRPYRVLLASRARAQMQYRTSFVTDILGTVGVGLAEFAEVWIIFHNVDVLGGLDFTAALLVFALSNLAFSLADMFVGHLDQLPRYIRAGQVDAFYVRPLPLLAQLMTSDLSLRRIGRLSVALVVLTVALTRADIDWSAATVALIVLTVVSGTAIFSALFTAAGGLQFFLVDGVGVHQRLHLRRVVCRPAEPAGLPRPAAHLLDVRRADRLRRLHPGRGHPRPAGRPSRAPLAGVVHAPGSPAGLGHRRPLLEARDPSLPRSRRMSIDSAIIETRDLVREFKKTRAVDRMTFSVAPGEAVGYIGANGAGKSTTIKMLTGILKPTAGHVRTCGLDPMRQRVEVARRVGVVFGQRSQLWWDLPLRDSFAHPRGDPPPRRAGRRGRAPTCSSSSSRWGRSSARRCARCRSASGCGPRSRPRSCTPRSCSSSTSRRSVSTCSRSSGCASSSSPSDESGAPPCC